jgi:hypothetical protein
MYGILMDSELMDKIEKCVCVDLMNSIPRDRLSAYDRIRYEKQCSRLYSTCVSNPADREYIDDRYASLIRYANRVKVICEAEDDPSPTPPPVKLFK